MKCIIRPFATVSSDMVDAIFSAGVVNGREPLYTTTFKSSVGSAFTSVKKMTMLETNVLPNPFKMPTKNAFSAQPKAAATKYTNEGESVSHAKKITAAKKVSASKGTSGPSFDMDEWYDVDLSLSRGGGNRSNVRFSGRKIYVRFLYNTCFWEPKESYKKQIDILKIVIGKLPASLRRAQEEIGTHPLIDVTRFIFTSEQYDAVAFLLFPNRKTTKQKNKALAQLLCYLGMMSQHCFTTQCRYIRFSRADWNKNGYRLVKHGDSQGLPTIEYI